MAKLSRQNAWQAIAFLVCASVLWIHLGDFGISEFRGGWLTGKILTMADIGALLFLSALVFHHFLATIWGSCGPGGHFALLAFLFLHRNAGTLSENIQGRILRPATESIRLEQLGYRWNYHPNLCRSFQHSPLVRSGQVLICVTGHILQSTAQCQIPLYYIWEACSERIGEQRYCDKTKLRKTISRISDKGTCCGEHRQSQKSASTRWQTQRLACQSEKASPLRHRTQKLSGHIR
jgi:hypothetical protein